MTTSKKTARKPVANIITMGCSKNLVDSERLMHKLGEAGYRAVHNPDNVHGGIAIVNTCGFIGDAKEESIEMILQCIQAKEQGTLSHVYVMGCLSERYAKDLPAELPEVDGWYGKFDWDKIVEDLKKQNSQSCSPSWMRTPTTPPHQAYLKIAEGCNRFCAFCAIPLITGRYKSRPIQEIVEEVEFLAKKGVKEFNVIAQDLSYYGRDLGGEPLLGELIDRLASVEGVEWIRLHYAYPADFPYDVLPVMAKHPNVCKYLDIALQHISDPVLKRMQRHITAEETRKLLARIRQEVPGIAIRTTLMVGFPGETQADFDELMQFVREQRFERMGAFAYCEEEDTSSAKLYADDVPAEVKEDRLKKLMALQEDIAAEINQNLVGKELKVIVDSYDAEEKAYRCRTEQDSPEVDQEVLVRANGQKLSVGDFCRVRITHAYSFDLVGEIVK